jgi:hypothetical protein
MSTALVPTGCESYLVPVVDTIEKNTLPYVTFFSSKGKASGDIMAQVRGIREPEPVIFNKGVYKRLSPLKFHVVTAKRLWVERDDQNNAISVLTKDPCDNSDPCKEEIQAVLLVYGPDGLTPATAMFRTGGCRGMQAPVNDLAGMRDPDFVSDWIARSPDHKAAASIPYPFARFTVTLSMQLKTSRSTGRSYRESASILDPTTAAEASDVADFLANRLDELKAVEALYTKRVNELMAL